MVATLHSDLCTNDGLNTQGVGGTGELHSTAQVVVVSESQRWVAELHSTWQQLVNVRCPFLEGEVAVAVEFYIAHGCYLWRYHCPFT